MKLIKIALFLLLAALVLAAIDIFCFKVEPPTSQAIAYSVGYDEAISYSIEGNTENSWISTSSGKRKKLGTMRYEESIEKEEKQRYIKKITQNWRRIIDDRLIVGFDKGQDELFYKLKASSDLNPSRIVE